MAKKKKKSSKSRRTENETDDSTGKVFFLPLYENWSLFDNESKSEYESALFKSSISETPEDEESTKAQAQAEMSAEVSVMSKDSERAIYANIEGHGLMAEIRRQRKDIDDLKVGLREQGSQIRLLLRDSESYHPCST